MKMRFFGLTEECYRKADYYKPQLEFGQELWLRTILLRSCLSL